jgi:hypothetical protein
MFLPRFSTRTMFIILAVAALLFAIVSQGLIALSERWERTPDGDFEPMYSYSASLRQIGIWRQAAAALSVAAIALALLMTINAAFFLLGWALSTVFRSQPTDAAAFESGDRPAEPPLSEPASPEPPSLLAVEVTADGEDKP